MRALTLSLIAAALSLAACGGEAPDADAEIDNAAPWRFEAAAPALRAASCPDGRGFGRGEAVDITVTPVEIAPAATLEARLTGLVPVGAWALSSGRAEFGGLSGLAALPSGNLLTVSDRGGFFWIEMRAGAPSGAGHFAAMLDDQGRPLTTERQRDAEGLALRDGLALISLERDHRILAFDLEGCGTNALGVRVADLARRPSGMSRALENNGGAEGLALTADGRLMVVIETLDEGNPVGTLGADGVLRLPHRLPADRTASGEELSATGLDIVGDTLYLVTRAWEPAVGTTVMVSRAELGADLSPGPLAPLARLGPTETAVDNFEGILVQAGAGSEGADRLYLLADDNFSASQRTLLFAFDLTGEV